MKRPLPPGVEDAPVSDDGPVRAESDGSPLPAPMLAAAPSLPAFSALAEGERLVSLLDGLVSRETAAGFWGGVRVHHIRADRAESPPVRALNHLVSLQLSGPLSMELYLDELGWHPHRVPAQTVLFLPARTVHGVRIPRATEFVMVEIDTGFAASVLGAAGRDAGAMQPAFASQDAFARHVVLALAEHVRAPSPSALLEVEALAAALVHHFARRAPAPRPVVVATLSSPKLRQVLDFVAGHLDAPLTVRSLSEMVDMDMFQFTRAFKQSTGLSPHRYVLQARIDHAKELLRDPALPITEVALQAGFSTPSHFSVTFRRITGQTPREFRDGRGQG